MLTWEGIKDTSSEPKRVWFSRLKDSDPWKPLRKSDCEIINLAYRKQETSAVITCGRATVDLKENIIKYNFYNAPSRQICSAVWFTKVYKNEKDTTVTPITSTTDEMLLEEMFIEANEQVKYGADNVDEIVTEVELKDATGYKIFLFKVGNNISIKKRPISMISLLEGSTDLQRGYGDYTVEGEEEELALGNCKHLSFVIHGIGEAMWKKSDGTIPTLVESVESMRSSTNKKLYTAWKTECQRCEKKKLAIPPPPNRIEFIPVEWFDKIHCESSRLKNNLLSTTLGTIPKLRSIANDVIFDVLMYLTPEFCEEVLTCVTDQIIDCYKAFHTIHADFIVDGTVSLIGHSLGSVITWDILSLLGDKLDNTQVPMTGTMSNPIVIDDDSVEVKKDSTVEVKGYKLPHAAGSEQSADVYRAYAGGGDANADAVKNSGTWGPATVNKISKTLPFVPKFTFLLGSPLGLFLTLRGAKPVFNQLRLSEENEKDTSNHADASVEPSSPFSLPSVAVYNVFHPSDPVAYRIEPTLLPEDFEDRYLPKPCFVTSQGKGVRLHVKAQEIGDNILKTFTGIFERVPDTIPSVESDLSTFSTAARPIKSRGSGRRNFKFALGGTSDRVDYQLQQGVIENEYLSAVSAHSSYWTNEDLQDFLIEKALT